MLVEEESEIELVGARAPDGDRIFILNLSDPDLSAAAARIFKKKKRAADLGGASEIATLNNGFTLIGTIGLEGINAGTPSLASKSLARECAIRPRT